MMFIRYFALFFALFSPGLIAQNPLSFKPDFSGQAVFVPQGTSIMPLCADPSSPLCFNQWTNQAVPLASYLPNLPTAQYNYFLPAFIPSPARMVQNPENEKGWEEMYIPRISTRSSRRRRSSRESKSEKDQQSKKEPVKGDTVEEEEKPVQAPKRKFWRRKDQPNKVRVVETDSEGKTTVQEGQIAFINETDIKATTPTDIEKLPDSPAPDSPKDTGRSSEPDSGDSSKPAVESVSKPEAQDSGKASGPDSAPVPKPRPKSQDSGDSSKSAVEPVSKSEAQDSGKASELASAPPVPKPKPKLQANLSYQTVRDTNVLPSTIKEMEPGCFVINKTETNTQTEAGFCFDCNSEEENSVLTALAQKQNLLDSLQNYLYRVSKSSQDKITKHTVGNLSNNKQICSPEISLQAIINNFNETCPPPYKNNFSAFFKKAHCESCEKGVPSEIMLAMMSLESAGICQAMSDNRFEKSSGLFQVDGNQHQCRDEKGKIYKRKTKSNLQCLKNPINNLNKSIDILRDHYQKVNPTGVSQKKCKNWVDMKPKERDAWRRGVSAYNGGPGWVTRAIKSVRDNQILSGTSHLIGTHKSSHSRKYKNDTASWEDLRAFYFIEKLSQKRGKLPACNSFLERDSGGSGRQICLTVSNLAHTEAVLGREVKGSPPGMIEIWSQYKRNNPVKCN